MRTAAAYLGLLVSALLVLTACSTAQDVLDATDPAQTSASAQPSAPESPVPTTEPTGPTETLTSEPTPPEPPEPVLAARPKIGDCFNVSMHAFSLRRDASFAVPCSKRHTAETFAVFAFDKLPGGSPPSYVGRACERRFEAYTGASAAVSTIGLTVIAPTSDQVLRGAMWLRCDAIEKPSYNGTSGEPRKGSVKGLLKQGVPAAFRGCTDHLPSVTAKVYFSPCAQRHRAELIPVALNLGGPEASFPGLSTARSRSIDFCESTFQDYVPETLNYYYYFPTLASWQSGSHDASCWAVDTTGNGLPPL